MVKSSQHVHHKTIGMRVAARILNSIISGLLSLCALLMTVQCAGVSAAQESVRQATVSVISEQEAALFEADIPDKVLALLQPPVANTQIPPSDYLLLDAPPIAQEGAVSVRLMSEIPGTNLFLLFNNTPRLNQPSLLSVQEIPSLTKADVRVSVQLFNTTELLLVARANGRWYKVVSEVKVAQKESAQAKKHNAKTRKVQRRSDLQKQP